MTDWPATLTAAGAGVAAVIGALQGHRARRDMKPPSNTRTAGDLIEGTHNRLAAVVDLLDKHVSDKERHTERRAKGKR